MRLCAVFEREIKISSLFDKCVCLPVCVFVLTWLSSVCVCLCGLACARVYSRVREIRVRLLTGTKKGFQSEAARPRQEHTLFS